LSPRRAKPAYVFPPARFLIHSFFPDFLDFSPRTPRLCENRISPFQVLSDT